MGENCINGYLDFLEDYASIVIPKEFMGFTDNAYQDLCATANERESISVDKGNKRFKAINNCLIDTEEGRVVLGCKGSIIPKDCNIKAIGAYAFSGIGDMESDNRDIFTYIDIPDSVEIIEHHAFADSGLTDIMLPCGLKKIGAMAFMLTRIGKEGKSIHLPDSVEKMGIGVFAGCTELRRPRIFSKRYKSEGDCIVDRETKTIIAVHNGIAGEILPTDAEKIEMLTFMGQKRGTRYFFEDNIKEIRIHPLGMPSCIEFPITIVTHKNTYAHRFALEHNLPFELW